MFHGLTNEFLYSAYRIGCEFDHSDGTRKAVFGTGFFVKNADGRLCLITNRHMLELSYKCTDGKYAGYAFQRMRVFGKTRAAGGDLPVGDQEFVFGGFRTWLSDTYENDVICLTDFLASNVSGRGSTSIDYFIPLDLLASEEQYVSQLSICDFVAFPGYPDWYDKRENRPILRTGAISSDPRFDYSWTTASQGQCLAYEAFSFGGSSGSPVFAVQKGPRPGTGVSFAGFRELLMIGINAGHLPAGREQHSGISYLYKSYVILDLLRKASS